MDGPIHFLDAANGYGVGRSEERLGSAIRAVAAAEQLRRLDQRASKTPRAT